MEQKTTTVVPHSSYEQLNQSFGLEYNRDLQFYCAKLGLHLSDFKDKDVLDIGSGGALAMKTLYSLGIAKSILCINPHTRIQRDEETSAFISEIDVWDDYYGSLPEDERKVIEAHFQSITLPAEAPGMGLKPESFDLIVSVEGVPFYIKERARAIVLFAEVAQLLREGGEFRCFPAYDSAEFNRKSSAIKIPNLIDDPEFIKMLSEVKEKCNVEFLPHRSCDFSHTLIMKKRPKKPFTQ